jgi:hypothetical protein
MQTGALLFSIRDVRPNPATNMLKVDLQIAQDGIPVTVELYNVLGQSVRMFTQGVAMPSGVQSMDLDVSGLPSGTYSVHVTTPGQTSSHMLLIQR